MDFANERKHTYIGAAKWNKWSMGDKMKISYIVSKTISSFLRIHALHEEMQILRHIERRKQPSVVVDAFAIGQHQ